jgi:uncharacterized protein YndB with AHSA1/START domain
VEISHEMKVLTKPEKVYAALTEQTGIASWFTSDTSAEPNVGAIAEFRFDRAERIMTVQVVNLQPFQRVEWQLRQGMPGWENQNGLITWMLTPTENGTIVRFSHGGWDTTNGPFASVSFKWAGYMTSLKKYLETGFGTPVS